MFQLNGCFKGFNRFLKLNILSLKLQRLEAITVVVVNRRQTLKRGGEHRWKSDHPVHSDKTKSPRI